MTARVIIPAETVEKVEAVLSKFYPGNGGAALTRKEAARAVLEAVADDVRRPACKACDDTGVLEGTGKECPVCRPWRAR